jgi:hypothetical protein
MPYSLAAWMAIVPVAELPPYTSRVGPELAGILGDGKGRFITTYRTWATVASPTLSEAASL